MRTHQTRSRMLPETRAHRSREDGSHQRPGTETRAIARAGALTAGLALAVGLAAQPAAAAPRQAAEVNGEALSVVRQSADASPAAALDDRWLPWLGCWAPVEGADTDRICIVPNEDGEGVLAQTIENDEVTHRVQIFADGARRRLAEAGCEGWETGSWSADGRRIFLSSELGCEGGLTRSSSGVLTILPDGAWLDVEVVQAGEQSATRVLRHRPAAAPAAVAAEVATRLEAHEPRIAAARSDAGRRLDTDDVLEVFEATDVETVNALLLERGERFTLDAAGLRSLAEAGVPGDVTDLMIALSFPDDFVIDRAAAGLAAARPIEPESGHATDPYAFDRFGRRYSARARYGSCMLYDAYYGMPFSRYGSGYGCPTFGMGYGSRSYYGPGGWSVGSGRPIVARVEPEPEPEPGGRLVKGQGYVDDQGLSRGRRAVRRGSSSPDNSSSRMGSNRSTGSRSTASSSSSSRTGSKASSSSSSSSSGRRAVKKRKGGGS